MTDIIEDEQYVQKARDLYEASDGDVEVDDGAVVSRGADDGAYVQAWVWVSNVEFETAECSKCGAPTEDGNGLCSECIDRRVSA